MATAAIDPIDVGNCPDMIASPREYGCKVLLQCVTIVGVVRIFFETARESDPGSGLAVSIYQSAIFSALVLMIGGRAASPASRESPGGKRHIGTMKTVSARHHEFSDLLSRVEHGEEILITKRSKPVAILRPYRLPLMTAERKNAIQHAIDVMAK
jgi:prevent-host-death family protein